MSSVNVCKIFPTEVLLFIFSRCVLETEVISFLMRLRLVVHGCDDKVWRASIRITEICWMFPARYIGLSALLLFNVLDYCWLNSVLVRNARTHVGESLLDDSGHAIAFFVVEVATD